MGKLVFMTTYFIQIKNPKFDKLGGWYNYDDTKGIVMKFYKYNFLYF